MALEQLVHALVDSADLQWILTDQAPSDLRQAHPSALGIGREIRRAQRADFTDTGQAAVGLDDQHGAVEGGEALGGPAVGALLERKVDLMDSDACDLHGCT